MSRVGEVHRKKAVLALEDGTVFVGAAFGAKGTQTGEAVFNTSLCGYQEILTDPSYCRQIVTMTAPQIGNYGIADDDEESAQPQVAGLVIKELAPRHSNYRATSSLQDYLAKHGVIGIEGIDTRALTRCLRTSGAMRAVITTEIDDPAACVERARAADGMIGADLVSVVAPKESVEWSQGLDRNFTGGVRAKSNNRIVAVDCGMKRNILRHLVDRTGPVRVVPPSTSAAEILDHKPDGVMISNGPGDPAAVLQLVKTLRDLVGRVPLFGICLGHQVLGLALGAKSFKLKFGHRGGNQPVQNIATGRVEITSQNHGFAIDPESLKPKGAELTHINLNDKTLEGFSHPDKALFAVQYHPEASPGPHDATYLFDCFAKMMETGKSPTAEDMAAAQHALQERRL